MKSFQNVLHLWSCHFPAWCPSHWFPTYLQSISNPSCASHTALCDLPQPASRISRPVIFSHLCCSNQTRLPSVPETHQAHCHLRIWKLFLYLEYSSSQLCIRGSSFTFRYWLQVPLLVEAFPDWPLPASPIPSDVNSRWSTYHSIFFLCVYYLVPPLNCNTMRAGILSYSQLDSPCLKRWGLEKILAEWSLVFVMYFDNAIYYFHNEISLLVIGRISPSPDMRSLSCKTPGFSVLRMILVIFRTIDILFPFLFVGSQSSLSPFPIRTLGSQGNYWEDNGIMCVYTSQKRRLHLITGRAQWAAIIFILIVLTLLMEYLQMPIAKSHTIAMVVVSWGLEKKFDLLSSATSKWGLRFVIWVFCSSCFPLNLESGSFNSEWSMGPAESDTQASFPLVTDLHNFLYQSHSWAAVSL